MNAWQEAVSHYAAVGAGRWLSEEVIGPLQLIPPQRPLLVACSGGADSTFLSILLAAWVERSGQRLMLAHFNHGLRGEAADGDQAFVEDFAQQLGLECRCGRAEPGLADDEASLREARYAWLNGLAAEVGAGALLLGHHADDAAESLLMAVLSGSGLAGLAAPRPLTRFAGGPVRLRPLLELRRSEIEEQLRLHGLAWCEDASNHDLRYTRNWVRAELLPLLAARFPQDIMSGMARTRELADEALQAIDWAVEGLQLDISDPDQLQLAPLGAAPAAVLRRALMRWWLAARPQVQLPRDCMEELIQRLRGKVEELSLPINKDLCFRICPGSMLLRVELVKSADPAPWAAGIHVDGSGFCLYLPDGACLCAERVSWPAAQAPYLEADPRANAWLQTGGERLLVRQWQAGDRYRPLGAPGRRKLQDMFTDAKLSRAEKLSLPVLCNTTGDILWVPGFAPAEHARVRSGTDSALKLTYLRLHSPFPQIYGG